MRMVLIFGLAFTFILSIDARADEITPCQVHVILFVPADVKPTTECQQQHRSNRRLRRIVPAARVQTVGPQEHRHAISPFGGWSRRGDHDARNGKDGEL